MYNSLSVVAFNHRSVFPIMFDGAAVERWWKSALVFRLYCREEAQQMVRTKHVLL